MMYDIILPAGITIVLIFGIGFVLASLYTRSSRDEAYVRTGLGGQKVVLDGAPSFCRSFTPSPGSI